ncbi:hypothetical protein CQW23_21756 [Capsicum baccatum]|uniref:Uncharacterized protein n=1 Tax=Capsicum baccatum TaxID=33114 RepID=A0A2G2VZ21_CAPBA|nr:hypothetical protein CQW23_21756 [Capsicum baccatum]
MAHKVIEDMIDQLRRIKSRGDLNVDKIGQTETLETELKIFITFIKYYHVISPDSLVEIPKKAKLIVEMLHSFFGKHKTLLNSRLVSELQEFNEESTSLIYNFELNGSYMLQYIDYLNQNLDDALGYLVRFDTFSTERINILRKTDKCLRKVTIIQNKMRFIRYLYGAEINGYVDHEKLEGLDTLIKFLADNVGRFCLPISLNEDGADTFNIKSKPPYLLFLVVLVELEMKNIFLCELKASKFIQSRTFKDKKLPKGFLHHLHRLLVYLRNKNLDNLPANVSARKFDVAIEFLLVFLSDVPNHLLADDASKIDLSTIKILDKIEDLKAQVQERYYQSLEYSPFQFPTTGGLSFLDSHLRKLNEMSEFESGFAICSFDDEQLNYKNYKGPGLWTYKVQYTWHMVSAQLCPLV